MKTKPTTTPPRKPDEPPRAPRVKTNIRAGAELLVRLDDPHGAFG